MKRKMLLVSLLILCVSVVFADEFDRVLQTFDVELDSTMSGYNETQLYYVKGMRIMILIQAIQD